MTSKTSKHTVRRSRWAAHSTKRSPAKVSAREAERTLLEGGQLDAVKAAYFCEAQRDLPIAGTPRPKPCPWCGITDCSIVIRSNDAGNISANVQCDHCGAEAPYACEDEDAGINGTYAVVLRAANFWNQRGGKAFAKDGEA